MGSVKPPSAKQYLRLNGKYLKEAERLLARGDYPQASEKLWGASAEMIKAVASKRGIRLGAHRSLGEFVDRLGREHPEWSLMDSFLEANALHTNFYEDWLPPSAVRRGAEVVKDMVDKLRTLV